MRAHRSRTRRGRVANLQVRPPVWTGSTLWLGVLLVAVGLAVTLGFVYLRSATDAMIKERDLLARRLSIQAKEEENLWVELESYKRGDYILSAVVRLGLPLRPPAPGQVRRVTVRALNSPDASSRERMVAVR